MRKATFPPKIKEPMGWIAAGDGFRRASRLLSDGAFKLFAHLALEADCRTGCVQATYKTLAADLKKSKRAIGTYSTELNDKGVCKVRPGENQYCKTTFEICDSYWAYERRTHPEACELESYITAIQEIFLALGCTTGECEYYVQPHSARIGSIRESAWQAAVPVEGRWPAALP